MIQRLDPGGLKVGTNTTTMLNGGFNNDNSFVGLTNAAPAGRSDNLGYNTSLGSAFIAWFFPNAQESIFGFAVYVPSLTFTAGVRFCTFADGGTNQVDVRTDATGHLFFTRNGTTIGGTSVNALSSIGWYYLEFKSKIASGTAGSCEVRVKPPGGSTTVWLTVTGVNTQATANAFANRAYLVSRGAFTQYWKDIYVLDTATGVNKTYLGDTTVLVLFPTAADATFQQWTPNTGTQTAAVQDGILGTGTYPDGDTTYISDTVSGHVSAFQHQSLTAFQVFGVIHGSYARTATTGSFNQVLVQGGTVVETSAPQTLATTYKWFFDIQEQNPAGSVAWTASTVNSTNLGVKNAASDARTSQEFLLVAIPFGGGTPVAGKRPQVAVIS